MLRKKAVAKPKRELPKGIDSKYEARYLKILEDRKYLGQIRSFYLKPGSFRLGIGCHYEPDFLVIAQDGTVEYHEVKGRTRFAAASMTKIKAAAYQYPDLRFVLCYGKPVKRLNPITKKQFNDIDFEYKEIE